MKPRIASLCIAAAVAGVLSHAGARAAAPSGPAPTLSSDAQSASPTQAGTPQRSKMKTCNADAKAKSLHGDDRRVFMKQCLSGKAPPHS
jgi:hypothetical protein